MYFDAVVIFSYSQFQKSYIEVFPPGGAWSLTEDFSVVGPQLLPEITLCPNRGIWLGLGTPWDDGGVYFIL